MEVERRARAIGTSGVTGNSASRAEGGGRRGEREEERERRRGGEREEGREERGIVNKTVQLLRHN